LLVPERFSQAVLERLQLGTGGLGQAVLHRLHPAFQLGFGVSDVTLRRWKVTIVEGYPD
jgi:hypothetical protein